MKILQKNLSKACQKNSSKHSSKSHLKIHQKIRQKIHQKNSSKCFSDISNTKIVQCRQKIRSHFSNKMILKLKLSKNVFCNKCSPKLSFFNEIFFQKI